MSVAERVSALAAPLLAEDGLELFDVEYGGGRLVVLADRPGGVDLDSLTRATQRISAALDREDPVPGHYVLEVSSPGLERPLRRPEHFRRAIGSTIAVKLRAAVEGERRLQGPLTEADETGCVLGGRRLAYGELEKARTVFEWGPLQRPGKPAKGLATKPAKGLATKVVGDGQSRERGTRRP